MKAAIIRGVRDLVIEDRPKPKPGHGEALVAIRSVGVCGSDVHGFEGLIPDRRKTGLVMGHEASGEVVETGDGCETWCTGDRVAIDPQVSCGRCIQCRKGWMHLCDNRYNLGSSMLEFRDGTLCEFITIPEGQLRTIPDNVSYDEAAMIDPAGCIVHLFNRFSAEVGSTVAIFGAGTMGLIAVQVAGMIGAASIIAVDLSAERLALARGFGADVIIDPAREDPVGRILEETGGYGADTVIEAVGIGQTYKAGIEAVKKRGTVIALGYIDEAVSFPMRALIFREINVLGSTGFTSEADTVLRLLSDRKLDVSPLITHGFPLVEVQRAFETAADPSGGAIKVMVHP